MGFQVKGAQDVWGSGCMGLRMYGAQDIWGVECMEHMIYVGRRMNGAHDIWGIGCMERRFVGRWMYGALVNRALDERSAGYKGPRM